MISSSAIIEHSMFFNLSSKMGPAIYSWDQPQSIRDNLILNVSECFFINNSALESGGNIAIEDVNV
jgi:predicted outer membrane repeat protein